jgi:hypothetical protein
MNAIGGNRVAVLVEFGGKGGGGGLTSNTRRHPKNAVILLPTALVDITHHYHQYYHCPQQYQQFNRYHHPFFFVPLPHPVNLRNTSTTASNLYRHHHHKDVPTTMKASYRMNGLELVHMYEDAVANFQVLPTTTALSPSSTYPSLSIAATTTLAASYQIPSFFLFSSFFLSLLPSSLLSFSTYRSSFYPCFLPSSFLSPFFPFPGSAAKDGPHAYAAAC